MAGEPSGWGRLYARLQGEVPAEMLEAYRRASLPVFELMDEVEARRLACVADGLDPWTIPPATRAEFLCAWNAFVLQSLGNDILGADYAADPATMGFVPRATADQVLACYSQVETWLDRAHQARANPDYRLDIRVPAELPPWSEDPAPASHLRGLVTAMRAVGDHAAGAMAFLPETALDPEQQRQINRIRQIYASAQSKARYAAELHGADPAPAVQARVEPYAREAIERFYQLGQLVADPPLATGAAVPAPAPAPATAGTGGIVPLLPSNPGFDEWTLTDPLVRAQLRRDRRAREAIHHLWRTDPDPARTLGIYADIFAALQQGDVVYATTRDEGRVGHGPRCPWGPIYAVERELTLDSVSLRPGEHFVLEVRAPPGAPFIRRIVRGPFPQGDVVIHD